MNTSPMVLILCTGNSCRSQMAEALLRKYHGDAYVVTSAGTDPKDKVHPLAVRVMEEIGIDISRATPKSLEGFLGHQPVRHLIIVCDGANGTCPRIWPGAVTRDFMPFEDPAAAQGSADEVLAVFRRVRDEIAGAMKSWTPVLEKAGR